jgi:hypothetical protein
MLVGIGDDHFIIASEPADEFRKVAPGLIQCCCLHQIIIAALGTNAKRHTTARHY